MNGWFLIKLSSIWANRGLVFARSSGGLLLRGSRHSLQQFAFPGDDMSTLYLIGAMIGGGLLLYLIHLYTILKREKGIGTSGPETQRPAIRTGGDAP